MTCYTQVDDFFPLRFLTAQDSEWDTYQPQLLEWIQNYKKENEEGRQISNRNGAWQSEDKIYDIESFDPFMQKIWSFTQSALLDYTNGLHPDEKASEVFYKGLRLHNMWINVNPKGSYNTQHIHGGCLLSGILWVQVPENSGDLTVANPQEFQMCYYSECHKTFTPQEGVLAIFPSHVPHGVEVNNNDKERISIAMNFGF